MNPVDYCIRIGELLRTIDTKNAKIVNQHYSPLNLTAPSINILLLLNKSGPMRVGDIGSALSMVDSNVSAVCSRLQKMGLIQRLRMEDDQRVVKIGLTEAAFEQMEQISENVQDFQQHFIKHASEEELKDIVSGLSKLNDLMERIQNDKMSRD